MTTAPDARATVWDVAQRAGVSAMTVSRVINGAPTVSAANREKVMRAIEELQYRVNVAARAARIGTVRVGLLYSNPSEAFLSAFLVGALGECGRSGAHLILENCGDLRGQRVAIDRLIANGADGILVPPPLCDSKAAMRQLSALGVPTLAVATARPSPRMSAVRIDDYEGAKTLTNYLLSLGHVDIGFVKGDPEHTPAQLRYQAFIDTMREAGHAVRAERIAQGMFTYRSGLLAARELLSHPTRPTAIFASNDDMAAAVVAVAHGMHLRVPDDVAVCGFDDTPVATAVWPELTTIRQPITDMARGAVALLIEHIRSQRRGQACVPRHRLMPYALVVRDSTAGAAAGDGAGRRR
ncbi:LacI family DNA-binding transcriptional regulator [Massilia luteola]|uniref:LacI family DNA-binding transcriptional regulator n=1 Tax=Massilia luteola TaxID=3081751 RepID=UPI002ACBFC02|nr:LacI family DNA-binding transcriptional regulator [Massilia sp. Gc5]